MSDLQSMEPSYGRGGLNLSDVAPLRGSGNGSRGYGAGLGEIPLASQAVSWSTDTLPIGNAPHRSFSRELLTAHYVRKSYRKASLIIPVLQAVDLTIQEGEFVAIIGPSGCGKSTLLHVLATLDAPDSGEVCFEGHRIDNLPAAGRDILRNKYFGMVFQFYHLLPELTTLQNVLAPAMIGEGVLGYWLRRRAYHERAREMLKMVGLGHRLKHKPRELSGGEMQRTAIARALVSRPRVLLADEPTGNLDKSTGEEIMGILRRLNREQNLTIVMVTHDRRIADQADRTVTLVDGRVVSA